MNEFFAPVGFVFGVAFFFWGALFAPLIISLQAADTAYVDCVYEYKQTSDFCYDKHLEIHKGNRK